jgi:hypothetical protein
VIQDAEAFLSQPPSTHERFEKVAQLVEGFESSFGLELLASVHWIMKTKNPESDDDIVQKIHSWNVHKRQRTARKIALATTKIHQSNWLNTTNT